MNDKNKNRLHCPNPNCKDATEFIYQEATEKLVVVNNEANIVYTHGKFYYKCRNCGHVFSSELAPNIPKMIYG